ncbi:hypothetical protein C2S53_010873 [Perilla frutescens var. hirtella]|uniref:Legume lectin domain-containing protein n=1 Tax=Perilla frutescens var. hirtella TaxID=608512 RepID=A0AAD4P2S5_PERFH|nr:hypothetical protein C2S53_010873 [Perilla frutescens var. hirtella]
MSSSSFCRYLLAYFLLNLYLQSKAASTNLPFLFNNFGKDSNFESNLALYGDVVVSNDNGSLQIAGRIIYKKPINLVEIKSGNLVSFTNYFVFNVSGEKGGGLAFLMLPFGLSFDVFGGGSMGAFREREMKFLSVEFDATREDGHDERDGGVNESENHVGISVGLELKSGEMLQAWVDYEASGKRLEVRLSKLGNTKPLDPLLSYPIDLGMMWRGKAVAVGLSSSRMINLYSWGFRPRIAPQWMHSEPLDPEELMGKREDVRVAKSGRCSLTTLFALILGVGFAALGCFLILLVWTMLGRRRPVVPEEFAARAKESDVPEKYTDP